MSDEGRVLNFGGSEYELQPVKEQKAPERELTDQEMEDAMPHPCGFKLLIALPDQDDTYTGSIIIKTDETKRNEQVMSVVGAVIDMGPDAYKDASRFPSGPYCKVGDYVLIAPYQGQRFYVGKREFRLLNDDSILGVVTDPSLYRRL
jgi:co-chaperonin GroES (HSP10)